MSGKLWPCGLTTRFPSIFCNLVDGKLGAVLPDFQGVPHAERLGTGPLRGIGNRCRLPLVCVSVSDLREVRMNRMFGWAAVVAVAAVFCFGETAEARSCCRPARQRCCKQRTR